MEKGVKASQIPTHETFQICEAFFNLTLSVINTFPKNQQ